MVAPFIRLRNPAFVRLFATVAQRVSTAISARATSHGMAFTPPSSAGRVGKVTKVYIPQITDRSVA